MPDRDRQLVEELLNDRTYHIEFNGHLTNHSKHAVVALARLGVPGPRIKAYYDNYAKLTTYGYGLEPPKPDRHTITEDNWRQYLGQRTSFWSYCDFFDRRERELGLDEVLRGYVPELLPGWVGAFTHATIHLGWALDIGNRWMAIEGLSYMAFTYVSCHPERATAPATDDVSPVDSLLRLAGSGTNAATSSPTGWPTSSRTPRRSMTAASIPNSCAPGSSSASPARWTPGTR